MISNYLSIALRNIVRHKLYSFINICGLAIGLACAIFISLFVRDEVSYDRWLPEAGNLYRLELTVHTPGRAPENLAVTPFAMPQAMKDEIPEVRAITRLVMEQMTINVGGRQFFDAVDAVDPQFLQVIHLPLVSGDPDKVLSQPQSLVLSQSLAQKYFGDANPIGRTVTVRHPNCARSDDACRNQSVTLTVTGIMRDLPQNSQLMGDALMPNTSLADQIPQWRKKIWTGEIGYGFLVLSPDADPQTVIRKTGPILDRALSSSIKEFGLAMLGRDVFELHLTQFAKVHLNSRQYVLNMTPAGSWTTVYGFGVIGGLILLIACFNFMNLATARASMRAREIALRKCMGALRSQLIVQFLGEAVLMAIIAGIFALSLVEVLLPAFGSFMNRQIAINYANDWPLFLAFVAVTVVVGLLSGSYPALVLSGFRPGQVQRANTSWQAGSGIFRNLLVVLQFAVFIGLGIAMVVVFSQTRHARNADLGFQKERVLILAGGEHLSPASRESLSQLLRTNAGVLDTGLSNKVPFGEDQAIGLARVPGVPGQFTLYQISIDPDFVRVYHIHLVAGRMFSRTRSEDGLIDAVKPGKNEGHNIIINIAGAARLGFTPEQAVGKTIVFNNSRVRIIGVLPNIKFDGTRQEIKPTAYYDDANENGVFSIRLRGSDIPRTVAFIDKTWRRFAPSIYAQQYFLDENFEKLYVADRKQGAMFGLFVVIAITIACLGLFGLSAFTASRRTKEIGIRKVFGASTQDLVLLLLWQFSIPVLTANAIAWPVAWYYLHSWLQSYAYRISLSPFYFVAVGAAALIIAWATVFLHAWRVANAKPVYALHYE